MFPSACVPFNINMGACNDVCFEFSLSARRFRICLFSFHFSHFSLPSLLHFRLCFISLCCPPSPISFRHFFHLFFFYYFFHLLSSCAVLVPHYIRRGIFGHPVFMFAVSVLLYPALLPCLRLKVRLSRVA